MNREVVSINHIVFPGKNPDLKKVEAYLKENLRHKYVVEESGDILRIGSKFASEYCGSNYTKSLRGAMLKAKGIRISKNVYAATLVARINDEGIFLHDMTNIKKKRVDRLNSDEPHGK